MTVRLPRLLIGERRSIFALLLANGLAQGVLAVSTAWLVMGIFDRLTGPRDAVILLFVGLAVAVLSSAALRRSERVLAEKLGQHYVRTVRSRLYRRLLNSNPRDFTRRRKGAVLLKFVGDLSALRRWISLGVARLQVAGVAVLIALAALGWMHWPFALGVATLLALSSAWIIWQGAGLRSAISEARRQQARLASNVTEKLNGLATVQAFGQAPREQRLMQRQSRRLVSASVRKAGKIGGMRAVVDATAGTSVLAVLILAFAWPPANLSPGMLAAVISIIGFLTPPLRELGRVHEYWLAAQVAKSNLVAVADSTRVMRSRPRGAMLKVQAGAIRIVNVSVRGTLLRINAEAPPGARVAILGANGSGKSTLLGLVGRLFDPDKGKVLIDGQNIARTRLSSLREQVAYVSADLPLIRGSLRKNLCYGAGRIAPDRLQEVLRECELDSLIDRLDGGMQARITEGGSSLSHGERVRVALARALLRNPRILLLDEADANLDEQAVRALDKTIRQFPGTVVMASHRASMLDICDTWWSLRKGRLEQTHRVRSEGRRSGAVVSFDRDPSCVSSTVSG